MAKREEHESALRLKYGSQASKDWYSRAERRKIETLYASEDKAGDAIYAYIKKISPRDWSYGVPATWLYGELTFEDAIRPVGEKLSVVPPIAWGHSEART